MKSHFMEMPLQIRYHYYYYFIIIIIFKWLFAPLKCSPASCCWTMFVKNKVDFNKCGQFLILNVRKKTLDRM